MAVTRTGPLRGVLAVALLSGALATRAEAHPHVWITFETTVVYDKGTFVGVRHKWTFDEFYTAMAIEGLDKNKDGIYDREELAELAKVNIEGLKDFSFFTFPALAGKEIKVGDARDYWLEHKDGVLSLIFTLALCQPGAGGGQGPDRLGLRSDLFHRLRAGQDRSRQAERGCAQGLRRQGRRPRAAARQGRSARRLAGPARRSRRQHLQDHHGGMQRPMKMSRIFALFVALAAMLVLGAPVFAQQPAPPKSPFGAAPGAERSFVPPRPGAEPAQPAGPLQRAQAWVLEKQAQFNRELAAAVRSLKTASPLSATLMLAALSFAYGVLHAAGPGHGKAVISSYVLADGRTVRRGILLAFLAALIQALSALVVVSVLVLLLRATGLQIRAMEAWLETASWALVALVGVWLLYYQLRSAFRPALAHAGHHHHHADPPSCAS